jgi:hypothetical protein
MPLYPTAERKREIESYVAPSCSGGYDRLFFTKFGEGAGIMDGEKTGPEGRKNVAPAEGRVP